MVATSTAPDDAADDRTDRVGGSPDWTDLTTARQRIVGDRVELTVGFGVPAPPRSGDTTFNVAAFHDLDGDGRVDIEVWSNLGPEGWGTAVFDNRTGQARYQGDAEAVARDLDGRLVVTWPLELLGDQSTWRWSLASEYGTMSELGTPLAARDDLPDDDRPVGMSPSST